MHKILQIFSFCIIGFLSFESSAQNIDFDKDPERNLFIRLYGEIDYTKKYSEGIKHNGIFEARRMVPVIGYQFSKKLQFTTEIEIEHGNQIFVEQAHLKYQIGSQLFIRSGMMVVPMGIINENHEPTSFYSVLRPEMDRVIIPTTWRELGAGVQGRLNALGLSYQFLFFNGFKSYDGSASLKSSSGLRGGRQKGLQSYLYGMPNQSLKLEYYNINNLKLAFTGYNGSTQSTLFEGLSSDDEFAVAQADSSVVNTTMLGLSVVYDWNSLHLRAQGVQTFISGVEAYNQFAKTDLGKAMYGFYIELGYDLLNADTNKNKLSIFTRYSLFDTQSKLASDESSTGIYKFQTYVLGFNWVPTQGIVYKIDFKNKINTFTSESENVLAIGMGLWF